MAFDVFLEVTKDWTSAERLKARNRTMRLVSLMFTRNITRFAARLMIADGESPLSAYAKVLWRLFGKPGLFRKAWSAYADWFKADFHPWNHDNRALLDTWRPVFAVPRAA